MSNEHILIRPKRIKLTKGCSLKPENARASRVPNACFARAPRACQPTRMSNAYVQSPQRTRFARANQRVCPTRAYQHTCPTRTYRPNARASRVPTNAQAQCVLTNRPQQTRQPTRMPNACFQPPPTHALRACQPTRASHAPPTHASVSHPPMKDLNDVTNT
jgi:hypothetical protein